MKPCPCCSGQLLRHARHSNVYWFCPHCWEEMPDLSSIALKPEGRVRQLERLIRNSRFSPTLDEVKPVKVALSARKQKVSLIG